MLAEFFFSCLVIVGKMSKPLKFPQLMVRKKCVSQNMRKIPEFECDNLEVKRYVGRGSFGEVFLTDFLAPGKSHPERVVIKKMLGVLDEAETKRFHKEVRIMNDLRHHNIVEFKRVCFAPCALMMEYVYFSFRPFGSDATVSSLLDFLLSVNEHDCIGFEEIIKHAGTEIGKSFCTTFF